MLVIVAAFSVELGLRYYRPSIKIISNREELDFLFEKLKKSYSRVCTISQYRDVERVFSSRKRMLGVFTDDSEAALVFGNDWSETVLLMPRRLIDVEQSECFAAAKGRLIWLSAGESWVITVKETQE